MGSLQKAQRCRAGSWTEWSLTALSCPSPEVGVSTALPGGEGQTAHRTPGSRLLWAGPSLTSFLEFSSFISWIWNGVPDGEGSPWHTVVTAAPRAADGPWGARQLALLGCSEAQHHSLQVAA